MKNNPAVPGGSLKSKPTRPNAFGCSATSAFLFSVLQDGRDVLQVVQKMPGVFPQYAKTNRTGAHYAQIEHDPSRFVSGRSRQDVR
jgi:hypothetical protein